MDEEKLTEEMPEEMPEENAAETAAEEPVRPKVEGVRPAEGMPLPEKGLAGMNLWERARLFADDPDGYRTARRRG